MTAGSTAHRTIVLQHPADWQGFRAGARACLHAGVAPEQVAWQVTGEGEGDLFGVAGDAQGAAPPSAPEGAGDPAGTPVHVPRAFVALCESASLHRDPARFALLYRTLWRMAHEPALRHDPLDTDIARVQRMAAAVRRDMHKMRAFARFRPVEDGGGAPLHVAWFEPDHFIVRANAAFFVQRFTQMRWALLTPECSLHWDGTTLQTGPAATRADAPPPDAGEALWLTYYRHTFNPTRLKLDMMRREMPVRYWKNLPEAALIGELAQGAAERSGRMVEAPATVPRRRVAHVRSGRGT
ncbi:TIGR03915 family putative DNA repair protein [Acidovorax sp. NCPPB 3859]|nr:MULTISPECIES: TIGR03915 family putative DNA repair protein [unclassified Acidovorax]MDA8451652.1 TIGR03915 family putative DNA repair protein [Acidovorax sp. GBBC 3297]MDA8461098.1 TIGR03915 family putative DNA repair protein [Acidovorax sp. GBBC 3333]MDA8466132.1 TIGR03915 family putative DNA repair protein [Acidovorax sp. GBBC 3332]MDA8471168.1 TIGR03915 family putative DNA repair protein [Acidovorax sp. GBBC 3299]WCM78470.1 TIGR03915 family putative DNA repair protein [Acidovorax sp. GBB